ncbi:MAG: Fic/DOC family N-terminal domain-containing protein, partial [Thermotogota bacterium]|nr:Fic/DOC family N-terminal domain-containing protein [Thermotogota bacterium]
NIVKANSALAKFDGLLENIQNPLLFLSPLMTKEAVLSSRIEGTQASFSDILEFEASPKRKIQNYDDIEEVLNYREALLYATRELNNRPICLNLIRDIHSILLKGVRGQNKARGEFRKIQNWIGPPNSTLKTASYIPPSPEVMAQSLSNWEKYCHYDEKDRIVQLAVIHAQFEIIHPFLDGNGRIGRIMIPLFLYEKKLIKYPSLYVSEFFEKNRKEYYSNLWAISNKSAWNQWINYFLKAIIIQAKLNTKRAKQVTTLYDEMKKVIQEISKSRSAIQIQDFLFLKIMFETPDFTASSNLSKPHAARIIKKLLSNNIIKVISPAQGRRPAIYAFTALMKILQT